MNSSSVECYRYLQQGQRAIKFSPGTAGQPRHQVHYLPGLERRGTEYASKTLFLLTLRQMRILYWRAAGIKEMRHSLQDRNGSHSLELNERSEVISQEIYYPYGGTAQWAARSAAIAREKFRCFSGQERDVTGLSYYGFRYYSPWLMRWLNIDPAGSVDGLNLLAFTGNNPVTWQDKHGLMRVNGAAQQRDYYRCSNCCNDIYLGCKEEHTQQCRSQPQTEPQLQPQPDPISQPVASTSCHSLPVVQPLSATVQFVRWRFHPGTQRYFCSYPRCNKSFKALDTMNKHVGIHGDLSWYVCPWPDCGERFSNKKEKNTHYRSHTSKLFPCSQCNQFFTRKDNRNKHIKHSHNDNEQQRPYICPVEGCVKNFKRKGDLKQHMSVHSNHRYVCQWPQCGSEFTSKSNLRTHEKRHSNPR